MPYSLPVQVAVHGTCSRSLFWYFNKENVTLVKCCKHLGVTFTEIHKNKRHAKFNGLIVSIQYKWDINKRNSGGLEYIQQCKYIGRSFI